MASNSQFTEMFLEWPLSKLVSEILICPWTWLWWMEATWLYEHKQIPKHSSRKLLVRFWNNLIEMFLEWPFSELFLKFWSVNKHGISEWRLLALYRHKEILVNSSLKTTKKKKKMARAISKNQVSDPGPSWPSCLNFDTLSWKKGVLVKFKISLISHNFMVTGTLFIDSFTICPWFLAPLAKGQRAYVMDRCPSCARPSVR